LIKDQFLFFLDDIKNLLIIQSEEKTALVHKIYGF